MTTFPPHDPAHARTATRAAAVLGCLALALLGAACGASIPSVPAGSAPPTSPPVSASGVPATPPAAAPATRLAVLSGNPHRAQLAVVDAAGVSTAVGLPDAGIAWISSDVAGRLLATTADGRLFLAGPLARTGDVVERGLGDPGWREVVPVHPGAVLPAPLSFGTLSADGTTIAALAADFTSGIDFQLVLVDVASGAATALRVVALPDGAAPAWLPDGRLLVVARDPVDDRTGLLLVDPRQPERTPRFEREAYGIALSSDGLAAAVDRADRAVAVGSSRILLAIDAADGQPRPDDPPALLVTPPPFVSPGPFALDASGTRLAVTWLDDAGGPAAVMRYRIGPDGPAVEGPLHTPGGTATAVVAWLP